MSSTRNNIIALPNQHLRKRSTKVGLVTDEIRQIIKNMEAATLDWEDNRKHEVGVALAAVQIDKLFKIIIIRNNFDDKNDRTFRTYINPEITKYEGKIEEDYEGCLSVSDIYGKVPRYQKVRIKALDSEGKSVRLTAEGFLARVFQHEVDHTKGIVFIDLIKDKADAFFKIDDEGHLEALDYEKDIRSSSILWE